MSHLDHRKWRPVLSGELAHEALSAVEAIAVGLEAQDQPATITLGDGSAGAALLFAYLSAFSTSERRWRSLLDHHLERSASGLASATLPASLYVGFTGIGWAIEHAEAVSGTTEEGNGNEDLDTALLELLSGPGRIDQFDLIAGLVGLGVYALDRFPARRADACAVKVIERLAALAEPSPEGVAWRTPPRLIVEERRDFFPGADFDLGMAHGNPGIVAFLSWAADVLGIALASELANRAADWLLAQKPPPGSIGRFSHFAPISSGAEPVPSRVAWCYGDLGVSLALLEAGARLNRPDVTAQAMEVALSTAARPFAGSRVIDAGLCHGAVGVAHLFNRFYQATARPEFQKAAVIWFERALRMRRPGDGIGGYTRIGSEPIAGERRRESKTVVDGGFLMGSAGIALGLLAGISDLEPLWDRALLATVTPCW